ncbi:MAG TPA: nuclear transport factor 2 family protein [Gemmataceae bacterium]
MSTRVLQAARSAVLAVALAALVSTASGQVKPSVKALTLTPMDYIEIRQLVNRYAFALDTGSNNGYDYADLFAPDGEFMRPYAKGREQLAALARGPRLGPDNTVHYIMNHVIEPTPDGAIGKAYLRWPRPKASDRQGSGHLPQSRRREELEFNGLLSSHRFPVHTAFRNGPASSTQSIHLRASGCLGPADGKTCVERSVEVPVAGFGGYSTFTPSLPKTKASSEFVCVVAGPAAGRYLFQFFDIAAANDYIIRLDRSD